MDITFGRAAKYILSHWGHEILLQRRIWGKEAGPFELENPNTSNSFSPTLEKWSVRHFYARHSGMPNVKVEEHEGVIHQAEMLYYFQAEAKPKAGDRLYEQDDRYPGGYTTYIVSWAQPYRERGGVIAYYIAGVYSERVGSVGF